MWHIHKFLTKLYSIVWYGKRECEVVAVVANLARRHVERRSFMADGREVKQGKTKAKKLWADIRK